MARWIGGIVTITHAPEMGRWQVTGRDHNGWLEIKPTTPHGRLLASISGCGRVWIQQRDLTRQPPQTEELPI